MEMREENLESGEPMEGAIARRLGKLRGVPMDMSGMEAAIRKQIPPPPAAGRSWVGRIVKPLMAVAASLLVIGAVALAMLPTREVRASAAMMAQMHEDIVSGKIPTMQAGSIAEADRAIAAMVGNFPRLPESPAAHTMACCMKNVGNKRVACVLLKQGGVPVTMAVADASDMTAPTSPTRERAGVVYHVESVGKLNMVSGERSGRWVCLIGEMPVEQLMDIVDDLKFK